MGKKKHKDKASKSKKKKHDKEPVPEVESATIEAAEPEAETDQPAEAEVESSPYVEYVSTEDVMELVNSLDQNLAHLDESTQSMQQLIARNQQSLQRQLMLFKVIALVLVIGIFSVGYSAAKSNSRTTDNVDSLSASMMKMRGGLNNIDKTVGAMSSNMDKLDNKLNTLSANVAGVNQIVNKLATDVGKIKTDNANQPYDPWRTRRPMDRPYY
ncbi:MAG: hypothetical protein JSW45_04660 [Thiotrichales bacterium]|nr:MAG: hypothetical protein JSW45_04660 [Thiotrichales bacterium]